MGRTKQTPRNRNKKKKDEEEEEEEEEEQTTQKKGKGGAKAKDKAPAKGAGKKGKAAKEEEEEEEEEEEKPTRPKRGAKAEKPDKSKLDTKTDAKSKKKKGKQDEEEEEEEKEKEDKKDDEKKDDGKRSRDKDQEEALDKTAKSESGFSRKKSKLDLDNIEVKVDEYCPKKNDVNVYIKDNEIFDCKMNQSNVKDNNNKFYFIQVLQSKSDPKVFYCYARWGRVGVKGQDKLMGPVSEDAAIKEYEKKYKEKSEKGEYRVLDMDYGKDTTNEQAEKMESGLKTTSLKKPIADFVSLIFDLKMATKQMESVGYDAKKIPLGKLSKNNIQKGYTLLKNILEAIKEKKGHDTLVQLSNDFYSFIPHDVGFQKMKDFIITDEENVRKKLELLDSLSNIKTTYELIEQKDDSSNLVDSSYKKLKTSIEVIEKGSKEYNMIQKYIDNTKENARVSIVQIFKIEREGEYDRYTKDIDNKLLLWHGSRLANFVGILSQGLRIAPPEAPASGYRFGKGIYLADMFAKSHGYCASYGSGGTFCIMVCEGALGNMNELLRDDFNASNLPSGKHSTKALGHVAPPISEYEEVEPGIKIPLGKPVNTAYQHSACYHNEFIIYDVKQVRIKYLIWMREG